MIKVRHIVILFALATTILACDKAPDGVIPESEMDDVLVELGKAQAYTELHPEQFQTDSQKLVLKQSVLKEFGYSLDDFTRSLDWYAHNGDVFSQVTDKAVSTLQKQQRKLDQNLNQMPENIAGQAKGGSLEDLEKDNLWPDSKYLLLPGSTSGYYLFDVPLKRPVNPGQWISFEYKPTFTSGMLTNLLRLQYSDGSESYVYKKNTFEGWVRITVQTERGKELKSLSGYLLYNTLNGSTMFVDSIRLRQTSSPVNGASILAPIKLKSNAILINKPAPEVPNYQPKPGLNKSGRVKNNLRP